MTPASAPAPERLLRVELDTSAVKFGLVQFSQGSLVVIAIGELDHTERVVAIGEHLRELNAVAGAACEIL